MPENLPESIYKKICEIAESAISSTTQKKVRIRTQLRVLDLRQAKEKFQCDKQWASIVIAPLTKAKFKLDIMKIQEYLKPRFIDVRTGIVSKNGWIPVKLVRMATEYEDHLVTLDIFLEPVNLKKV